MSPNAGLSDAEAARRRALAGPNVLPQPPRRSVAIEFARQLLHFFAIVLWVAAAMAAVAGLTALAAAIAAVVVINGTFAFAQEQRSERTVARLGDLVPRRATVRRGGQVQVIDAADIVVGDVVLMAAGDRVPADLEVVDDHGLLVDESSFTGESAPVAIRAHQRLRAGTFVVEGAGETTASAIGANTELAGLAHLTAATARPVTPLARKLHRLVRVLVAVAIGVGGTFYATTLVLDIAPGEGLLFAIGVTVALVPEGLLPTLSLSLAAGAQRMAHRQALVRRLESVETMGSTTMVCTDKTGTLTMNRMAVVEVWTPAGALSLDPSGIEPTPVPLPHQPPDLAPRLATVAQAAAGCAGGSLVETPDGWEAHGDPQEVALHVLVRRLGLPDDDETTAGRRFAFTTGRRRMSVVRGNQVVAKGAPEALLPLCTTVPPETTVALHRLTNKGYRVLAVAMRSVDPGEQLDDAASAEQRLTLVGLVALEDPPRPDVAAAIAGCRSAGIAVAMVTGDHPGTAGAIARQVGLATDTRVIEGHQLPGDDGELGALVDRDGVVVARVTPEAKLRIARVLRQRGHVVAMTGDGVNDGPALREADIGIAMGASGSDVAREAADLVLLDDHFATIVEAIHEGRTTVANIRKFLTYHLTDNVAELTPFVVWALSAGRLPLAIGVLQVLAIDLATDTLPAVALGAEPPSPDDDGSTTHRRRQPAANTSLLDRRTAFRAFGVLGPTEATMAMAAFATGLATAGWHPGNGPPADAVLAAASGAAFTAIICAQMANAFACRSPDRPVARIGTTNHLVVGGVVVAGLVGAATMLVTPVADALGQALPGWQAFVVAAAAAPVLLAVDTTEKWLRGRRQPAPPACGPPRPIASPTPTPHTSPTAPR